MFEFIHKHRSTFRIEKMCEVLGVSRSGYYKWRLGKSTERAKQRKKLVERIKYHYQDSNGIYGSPKITALLRLEGFTVGEKTVGRIMKELHLRG